MIARASRSLVRRAGLALCALCLLAAPAAAGEIAGSRFALSVVGGRGVDSGLIAQRAIEREWGYSEDSTYREIDLPGYRSEGLAMALSAAVPGAGQLYVGERAGLLFLAAEAAGLAALWVFRDRADTAHDDSQRYAGAPTDPSSEWSFSRFFGATGQDTTELQRLYTGDRDAFYHTIGFDDRYRIGWRNQPELVRDRYQILENRWQRHLKRARYATGAIVFNHLLAALDGLRAARSHNLPLEQNLRLKLRGSLEPDGPAMSVVLERGF